MPTGIATKSSDCYLKNWHAPPSRYDRLARNCWPRFRHRRRQPAKQRVLCLYALLSALAAFSHSMHKIVDQRIDAFLEHIRISLEIGLRIEQTDLRQSSGKKLPALVFGNQKPPSTRSPDLNRYQL